MTNTRPPIKDITESTVTMTIREMIPPLSSFLCSNRSLAEQAGILSSLPSLQSPKIRKRQSMKRKTGKNGSRNRKNRKRKPEEMEQTSVFVEKPVKDLGTTGTGKAGKTVLEQTSVSVERPFSGQKFGENRNRKKRYM